MLGELRVGLQREQPTERRQRRRRRHVEQRIAQTTEHLPGAEGDHDDDHADESNAHTSPIARNDSSRISLQSLARSATSSADSIARGYGSGSSTTLLIRPGRAVITITRVDSASASCRLWVTNTT